MKVRVRSDSLLSTDGLHNLDLNNVMYQGKIVGRVINFSKDFTEVDITDPVVARLIENGVFDQPVSMGYKVKEVDPDKKVEENKVYKGYGNMDRLRILKIM